MTLIQLTTLERDLGLPRPIAHGRVRLDPVAGDQIAGPIVSGEKVTFLKSSVVEIRDGVPERSLEIPDPSGRAAARWTIWPDVNDLRRSFTRTTEIPASGTHAFGDLVDVDPDTFLPIPEPLPSVQELLADALRAMQGALDAAASIESDREVVVAAEAVVVAAEAVIVAARNETLPARDLTLQYRDAAAGHAENARLYRLGASSYATSARISAEESADSADDSNDYRDLSATAASAASVAANDAEAARAAARQILEDIAADRGVPNGLAILDANGKLPSSMLPDTVLEYLGVWNPATNTPTLSDATGQPGDYYYVSADGNRNLGSGTIAFNMSDRVVHNGQVWQKWDTTDQVTSVAGRQGVIVLTKSDVGLPNVDNTSDANKPISTATRTALDDTVNGASVVGDNLIVTKVGGAQVNAGNVRGPQGIQGLQGDWSATASQSATGGPAINQATSATVTYNLTGNASFQFTNAPVAGYSYSKTLIIKQAASGGPFTVTFPASIKWSGPAGTPAPTVPTQAGYELIVHLLWNGTRWIGVVAGVFEP